MNGCGFAFINEALTPNERQQPRFDHGSFTIGHLSLINMQQELINHAQIVYRNDALVSTSGVNR